MLLAFVVAMPVLFSAHERATNAHVQTALVTEARLADLLSSVRQAESGMRGYIITGNDSSLDSYNLALLAIPNTLQALDRLLANGSEAPRLIAVHQFVGDKLVQLAQSVGLSRAGQQKTAMAQVNNDLDVGTMVKLRDLISQMQTTQARSLTSAEAAVERDSRILQAATAIAVLGTILLASFAVRVNRVQTSRLRTAEAALIAANEVLERKVVERTATLNASEARFRLLSESLPGIVYLTGPDGKTLYVNPQSCAYSGLTAEDMMGYGWAKTIHPEDLETCTTKWRESVASGQDYEMEFRLRRHDGEWRWFLDRAVALKNADGIITAWIGTSTDINDRKMTEAVMANTNALLEQRVAERSAELDRIFRLSTDILTVGGFDGYFYAVSPAWERIMGHPAGDALAKPHTDFMHPDDVVATQAALSQLADRHTASVENRYRRADGSWCWLAWRMVLHPEQQLIYGVARDVTGEREREEQLRQSQKMEVVGQLTGGVAHDFNNLLTVIMGSLELLQRGVTNADPALMRRVESATDAARRAAALTHRLLAFSRRQPLAPKATDVNRLLAGMSDMLHRSLGETVAVELVSGAGLWHALADANQLENAILNLAVNARDAMPEGGQLSIETQNAYLDESYVVAHGEVLAGQYVLLAISDTGCGMTAEVRAKVFEPFFTTKAAGQGTGLGLAQVYGFIKQTGGHVSVYSEPGHGTTVKLYLPRIRGISEAETIAAPMMLQNQGNGETMLVVEDEPGVRQFSAEVLADLGYKVLTAGNAVDALRVFEETPGIRLLFTDVVLGGGLNGRQLADEIIRRQPEITVLFTTGYTRNAIIHHGRLDDGVNFIGKPFTASALGEKVARLLEAAKIGSV